MRPQPYSLIFLSHIFLSLCLYATTSSAQQPTTAPPDKPLPPDEAAASIKLPPGFKATCFAAEPAITQPIAFTFDDRGRLWVIENFSYPSWRSDNTGHDRVTILEDTDNDGKHDKRTVFLDNGVNLSGIEVGFGGVWLASTPNFIFIPDKDGDDKPDGEPKILLDGFTLKCQHNVFGNLAWGPDGWLYGCHGITAPSLVGKPGTPDEKRQVVHCGVWRYHPVRHDWEVYANGTTNPWGIDWDERGEMFITNCVIKHLFHVIPGGHYVRMPNHGQDPTPYVYDLMESCADHQHWAGGHWTTARGGEKHHDFGGGHAHSGCMIYLGDNWPAEYRNSAFMLNIHGQRLNCDKLEPHGSSYIAHHGPDLAFSGDPWFRGLHCKYGPDGGVYISDWSDIGECHDRNEMEIDRTSGRIFKIMYDFGQPRMPGDDGQRLLQTFPSGDFSKTADTELIQFQNFNEWYARHARRILQERAATGKLTDAAKKTLDEVIPRDVNELLANGTRLVRKTALRMLSTKKVTGQLRPSQIVSLITSAEDETVRAHAIDFAIESRSPSAAELDAILAAAKASSPYIRVHLASAVQRIPLDDRWPIAEALLAHAEDADDQYLPLMYWYGFEPLVPRNVRKSIELIPKIQIPLVRQYVVRRLVAVREGEDARGQEPGARSQGPGASSQGKSAKAEDNLKSKIQNPKSPPTSSAWILDELLKTLATSSDPVRLDILGGLKEAYRGRRTVAAPTSWRNTYAALAASENADVREDAKELGVIYGDRQLISLLKDSLLYQPQINAVHRRRALELLSAKHEPGFLGILLSLLKDDSLRPDAIRALANYDSPQIPPKLVNIYTSLNSLERQDAIQTLSARPIYALVLLDAIEQGIIPRQDVSALTIRQLQAINDQRVTDRLTKVWGNIRRASADKQEKIDAYKTQLTEGTLKSADLSQGRAVFAKTCATCHRLFGEGAKIAPELTGSQRANLDYVLDNVLDPSGIVPREYQVVILRLTDGRILQGVILEDNPLTLTIQTANETLSLPIADIEARKNSPLSMMPEGLFDRLSPDEIKDLIAYLASPGQVPLPATP
ncbi:MAG TPA: PVC-type heme-binding CxxCH protein [Pirellulaceae bacterium]|jgi:putative membrane-bound dehydrogenase-like protein